jgi:transcriptional regulator with XRE-family HTH domain
VAGQRHYLSADVAAGLRSARRRLGLSFRDAAQRAGIGYGYLCELEHCNRCPSVDVARALIEALGLDADLARRLLEEARPDTGRNFTGDREQRSGAGRFTRDAAPLTDSG